MSGGELLHIGGSGRGLRPGRQVAGDGFHVANFVLVVGRTELDMQFDVGGRVGVGFGDEVDARLLQHLVHRRVAFLANVKEEVDIAGVGNDGLALLEVAVDGLRVEKIKERDADRERAIEVGADAGPGIEDEAAGPHRGLNVAQAEIIPAVLQNRQVGERDLVLEDHGGIGLRIESRFDAGAVLDHVGHQLGELVAEFAIQVVADISNLGSALPFCDVVDGVLKLLLIKLEARRAADGDLRADSRSAADVALAGARQIQESIGRVGFLNDGSEIVGVRAVEVGAGADINCALWEAPGWQRPCCSCRGRS